MRAFLLFLVCLLALAGCREEETAVEVPVRAMKAHTVTATPTVATRRFPAVLEPSEITALSFEITGAIDAFDLAVGQPSTDPAWRSALRWRLG